MEIMMKRMIPVYSFSMLILLPRAGQHCRNCRFSPALFA